MVQTVVSLKAMNNLLKKGNQRFWIELNQVVHEDETTITSKEIEELLSDYLEICEQTSGLPPHRSRDHAITISPYRYPHSQKTEIEHLVKEMMVAGIIRASTSPYSSLVLLVKKRDGMAFFAWIIGLLMTSQSLTNFQYHALMIYLMR